MTRFNLHMNAYQHKIAKIVNRMLVCNFKMLSIIAIEGNTPSSSSQIDAWHAAEPYLKFETSDGRVLTLSQAHQSMEVYSTLTDYSLK